MMNTENSKILKVIKTLAVVTGSAALEPVARTCAAALGAGLSRNAGVSFGLLKNSPALALVLSGVSFVFLTGFLALEIFSCEKRERHKRHRSLNRRACLALSVMTGGAAANFAQRLLYGAVTDWMPLPFTGFLIKGGLRFNLADVEIVLGAAAAVLCLFLQER